jgi:hypothetical protein
MMSSYQKWVRFVAGLVGFAIPFASCAIVAANLTGPVTRQSADAVVSNVSIAAGVVSASGVSGTTKADLASFAVAFNATRAAEGLRLIPFGHFRYDACMERRLFWIAEDPSIDPKSAWGHIGTTRSDGVPSAGCDGNLAGGMKDSGGIVAVKWWNSALHRISLYRPAYEGSMSPVCIYFAMTHGGVPDESAAFSRAAARWGSC